MSFNDCLSRLNQAQRVIAGVVFGVVVISFFAHNPMSGYTTESHYSFEKQLPQCSDEARRKYREFLTDYYGSAHGIDLRRNPETYGGVSNEIDEKVARCHLLGPNTPIDEAYVPDTQVSPLPFNLWGSNAPFIEWFGLTLHFIYLIAATFIIGAFFIFAVFAKETSTGNK